MLNSDQTQMFQDVTLEAFERHQPLCIRGGDTRSFLGRPQGSATILDTRAHSGVILYEPGELVLQVRSGTLLKDIETLLADHRQILGFEPPGFGEDATIGGVVATGLSGPARPYSGAVRDFILGVSLINGRGELAEFGGQVMKNVAGYDVSRLMTGAFGTLGLLADISIRLIPAPESEVSLVFECEAVAALQQMQACRARNLPVTASAWEDGRLTIRLAGHEHSVKLASSHLGGDRLTNAAGYWSQLKEQRSHWFAGDDDLWRLSLLPGAPLDTRFPCLIEWGGAQRWYRVPDSEQAIYLKGDGYATLFRTRHAQRERFAPLAPEIMRIHKRLKAHFDPHGIFNPGRMYAGL